MTESEIPTPYYIVYEDKLRANMEKLRKASEMTGVKIIMAFKANALWRTFPLYRSISTSPRPARSTR